MSLDDFISFLSKSAGVSGQVLERFDKGSEEHIFFKTYKSAPDFFFRAASIVTAPVCFIIYTAGFFLGAVFIACKSLVELVSEGPEKAKESANLAVNGLLMMAISLLAIFMSPVANLIDLIGGGVNTVLQQCKEEEFNDGPCYF